MFQSAADNQSAEVDTIWTLNLRTKNKVKKNATCLICVEYSNDEPHVEISKTLRNIHVSSWPVMFQSLENVTLCFNHIYGRTTCWELLTICHSPETPRLTSHPTHIVFAALTSHLIDVFTCDVNKSLQQSLTKAL